MTELYPQSNKQKGGKGIVPVANIDFFSQKSSLPTGSIERNYIRYMNHRNSIESPNFNKRPSPCLDVKNGHFFGIPGTSN